MNRRAVLAASAAGFMLPSFGHRAVAAASARREFRILRNGSDIGRHLLAAEITDDGFEINIEIDIVVRILGIAAYRYELRNREVWAGRRLVALKSTTNDDGDDDYADIRAAGDLLEIDGSGYSGTAPGDAATTSYYMTDFLDRRPWISTQTGKPLQITISGGPSRVSVSGELPTTLLYDDRGEWMGSVFDAGGEEATYELVSESGAIAPLWRAA